MRVFRLTVIVGILTWFVQWASVPDADESYFVWRFFKRK